MKHAQPLDTSRPIVLLGAGGHCRVLVDTLALLQVEILGYHAPEAAPWLEERGVTRLSTATLHDLAAQHAQMVMAFVGQTPQALQRRLDEMIKYQQLGAVFPSIAHPNSLCSSTAMCAAGVQVLAGSVVNAQAMLHSGAIVNTHATVEHDVILGAGCHVAPKATLLGGAIVGRLCYLGSGCVVIQNSQIPHAEFVKALTVFQASTVRG